MEHRKTIERNGIIYSAELYHWRQEYPHVGQWGFYIHANVFDAVTKAPVKIKKITTLMGNHPNYFWSGMTGENCSSHSAGPWYVGVIDEDSMGGQAHFDLEDGTRLSINDLRLAKPRADWSIGPIPIGNIPFSVSPLMETEIEDTTAATTVTSSASDHIAMASSTVVQVPDVLESQVLHLSSSAAFFGSPEDVDIPVKEESTEYRK